ncbi:MAG: tRNA 2-selenouridine(34) synthase MnmH [Bacteroidia bacterium]
MAISLSVNDFLLASSQGIILDVRSPGEYQHGHIPNAISFPIFTDEERAIVGTLYKQKGKTDAILKGLEIVGPKLKGLAEKALGLSNGNPLNIHCWRGGMRSSSMAILLQTAGIECSILKGGYKAYRNYFLSEFEKPWNFKVIGGKTGSGKTRVLAELKRMGEQVIDLEALAHHKGSAFGRIGELPQPTSEQFGNNLYAALQTYSIEKNIWVEDESHTIGTVFIPSEFYKNYRNSPLLVLDIPFDERLNYLMEIYGRFDASEIKEAFERITRKLGGQHVNAAIEMINTGDLKSAAAIALKYYDKTYVYGLENKDTSHISIFPFENFEPERIAKKLLETS